LLRVAQVRSILPGDGTEKLLRREAPANKEMFYSQLANPELVGVASCWTTTRARFFTRWMEC
jgi:hypothetical protein